MKLISKQVDYALAWLLALAQLAPDASLSVRVFAEKRNISRLFLQKITGQLREAGIVSASRGSRGGYRLAVEPAHLTLGEIIAVLEPPIAKTQCGPAILAQENKPITVQLEEEMLKAIGTYTLRQLLTMQSR